MKEISWLERFIFGFGIGIILSALLVGCAYGGEIDLEIIKQIESDGNPHAYNKHSGATGLYQFLPIAWEDVHSHYPNLKQYDYDSYVRNPKISKIFADKYFKILEKYLKYYDKPVTIRNLLLSYNTGIGNFIKGKIYKESEEYVLRYNLLDK